VIKGGSMWVAVLLSIILNMGCIVAFNHLGYLLHLATASTLSRALDAGKRAQVRCRQAEGCRCRQADRRKAGLPRQKLRWTR
jgi:hypothetical protein